MPDRDNWSASMLMHWVLTRDKKAVLSMVDDYGGSLVEGDNVTRIRPPTWEDMAWGPAVDASLSAEQQTKAAILRAHREIIPAWEEIYGALRRGDLDSWARPNGSGDLTRIGPIQWAGLRIRSLDGHDIAVPVDSEQNPLPLPRTLADYLSRSVPATSTPTVWPDPLLSAEKVMQLWPPHTIVEVLGDDFARTSGEFPTPFAAGATAVDPAAATPQPQVESHRKQRRGPRPGSVDRFGDRDRALFPELQALVADGRSVTAATVQLADQCKIAGIGSPVSRAKRLAKRYRQKRSAES